MRLAAAALALALSAGYASSFVPHPTCHVQNHQITGTVTSPSGTAAPHAQLSRLHARPRFKEEDFYFDDEDDFDDDEDDGYNDQSRSAPAARKQRQSPPRQRQRPQQEGSRRRSNLDIDSPSRRQSSKSRETLGTIALEEETDSKKMKEMTTTGSAAPIVPSRNGRRNNYREEDEDEWDEDEFDNEYFDDEFDDDYYDDDEDETSSGGNFWTNPEGGLDPYPSSGAGSRSGRRRKSTTRGRMPPSTAEPQPDTKPRGRSRSQSRERSANGRPSDAYGRPPPSRRRPGAIQKTTFRSGTPPPPPLMKDFYDRFFWYGFDPRETTSPTDRTMFGGTKGKFSGLDVLREVDGKPASRRGPHGERMRERDEYDEYDDDEWDDFEDEYDDYSDDDFDYASDKEAIIPKPLLPGLSIEEKRSSRPLPPRSRRRKENRKPRESGAKRNDRMWFDDDEDNDDDYDQDRLRSGRRNVRERKTSSRNNRRSRKGRFASNSEWASDEVSSWFTDDDDDDDVIDLWPSRNSNEDDDDEYWRDGSFEQPVSRRNSRSRRGRKGDRRSSRRREDDTPPVLSFVESIFGMDSRYIDEKAKEYEEKIGRAKPSSSTRNSRQGQSVRNEVSRRRRSGYAYRYEDDDDDSPPVAEFAPARYSADVLDVDMKDSSAGNVIDVPAGKMVIRRNGSANTRQTKKRRRKRPSWEDRESEELDRIPPAGITAYGPEGDVMGGIDARTFAALKASEEIREAKRKVAKREERVIGAEERILMLKADVEEQTRIFAQSRQRNSPRVRDAKRQMNMMVEDAARFLRKARAELDVAVEAMEDLEDRHWVLLSQVASDEEFARLNAKAEREEESEGVASVIVDDDIFNGDGSEDDNNDGVDTLTSNDDQPEDEVQVEILSAESKGETAESTEMQGDKEKDNKQPKSDK